MLEYERAIVGAGIGRHPDDWDQGYSADRLLESILDEAAASGTPVRDWYTPDVLRLDRNYYVHKYGFAIPDERAIAALAKYQPVLEVGAGTGYWAYEMRKAGVDVIATDSHPVTTDYLSWLRTGTPPEDPHPSREHEFTYSWGLVEECDAAAAVQKYPDRTLFCCWPSLNGTWLAEALRLYQGRHFVYVGEGDGGCCAEDGLFELLGRDWSEVGRVDIPTWYYIRDYLAVYERKNG